MEQTSYSDAEAKAIQDKFDAAVDARDMPCGAPIPRELVD